VGHGSWTNDDYESYAIRTAYREKPLQEVFSSNRMPPEFDPRNIMIRESCDSADNPKSTPVILALDVTGSMGKYAGLIATKALPKLMTRVLEEQPVTSPHIMFMGVDDVRDSSHAPLQVSQFEADIRILEQLRRIYLVGDGGGNDSEAYDMPWYFAAKRTITDSFEKRGEKGFLFTMGDEQAPYVTLTIAEQERTFGPGEYSDLTPAQTLKLAEKNYHVFHIVIEQGSYCSSRPRQVKDSWTKLMGTSVLFLSDFEDLDELVLATMKIVKGRDMEEVIAESTRPAALRHAFQNAIKASEG
jgi:hypothetical protein